ncbi:MAG: ASKHA domain-containing protein [Candidatus Omnitrophica bacterium]|nr:ASKHA domain-containing protein [Candidatus Omnitrophota bacterium]HOX54163.1 ASKHA domain-containing protein [Candidatus Omnitrophota bacterium]
MKFKVKFLPDNKEIEVEKGKSILAAAISAGLHINSSCGGDGVCGRCKVILKKGEVNTQPTGRISAEERKQGYYLACLTTVESDLVVEVPVESKVDLEKVNDEDEFASRLKGIYAEPEEVEEIDIIASRELFSHSPLATKIYLELPQPDLDDKISDLERINRAIREVKDIPIMQMGLSNVRNLGKLLRSSDWKVTVTLGKRNDTIEIVLIEPSDTSERNFGFAFDIGTTTISAQLINLNTKKVLGTKATFNKQATFGSDIITRIIFAQEKDGLERLHHAVIDGMNSMIEELVHENQVDLNDVTCCLCAGNTTMIHLLLKVDPSFIRREPYVPTANFVPVIRASEAGIKINPRGLLACVPGVSGYVGGDITAGILASGISETEDLSILIDIGTNGEIVLGNKDWMISCAASAGPAFEGSGVVCGMRATKGAIQRFTINPKDLKVSYSTIGATPPVGICGSGYIDIVSELLKTNIIDKNGKINTNLRDSRIRQGEFGREFVLVDKKDTGHKQDIVITEMDLDNLKRAKAAIFSATSSMLKHLKLSFDDVKKIYIAGGFGTYLDIEKAVSIGLLPDLKREKFSFIGNSSLSGARAILLSIDAFGKADEIAKKTTYFELSVEPGYMDEYVAALFFPHTDTERFPSQVK